MLLLPLALLQGEALAAGEWLTTEGGCKVWNPNPVPNEAAVWVGAVDAEGYASGKGILKWFENRNLIFTVEGTMLQGRVQGHGVLTGLGKVRACYAGDFIASERTGQGVLTYGDGFFYKGGFVKGRFQGKGSVKYSNGDRYEGDFVSGKCHGKGVFRWISGSRYEGDFAAGERTGYGVFIKSNGERYEGKFDDGKPVKQ